MRTTAGGAVCHTLKVLKLHKKDGDEIQMRAKSELDRLEMIVFPFRCENGRVA